LLAKFHQRQLTHPEFAAKHGVGLSVLRKWSLGQLDDKSIKLDIHVLQFSIFLVFAAQSIK
jgi:hypothetical protein